MQIGQEPQQQTQRKINPLLPLIAQLIAHGTPENQQRRHRKCTAQQLKHKNQQIRRIDTQRQQHPAQAPHDERLHARTHHQRKLPRQVVGRRSAEKFHAGIFQNLEMLVVVVIAVAEKGIEQGQRAAGKQDSAATAKVFFKFGEHVSDNFGDKDTNKPKAMPNLFEHC